MKSKLPIVLIHSMFKPAITEDAVLEALPELREGPEPTWVRISPDFQLLERYSHDYDWDRAAAEQKQQFLERLEPLLSDDPLRPVIYFGLAPIPLAFHLGTLVTHRYRLRVHQHHHVRSDWQWLREAQSPANASVVAPRDLGEDKSASGDLVLRVSTSHAIDPVDTRVALEGRGSVVTNVDLRVKKPGVDVFETQQALDDFCLAFKRVIEELARGYPSARTMHLFAAVQCGVAFRMGTHYGDGRKMKPVQTYQFDQHRHPRYAAALAIGTAQRASLLLLTADPAGYSPTSGLSEVKEVQALFESHRSRIEVRLEPGLRAAELQLRLDRQALILHFAGHGSGGIEAVDGARDLVCPDVEPAEGSALLLLGARGERIALEHDDLVNLIKSGRPRGVRCVVLSACHTDRLAKRLVEETPVEHAIGFAGAVDDGAAREFTIAFHRGLLTHGIVEEAVEDGKRQIDLAGRPDRDRVAYFSRHAGGRSKLLH